MTLQIREVLIRDDGDSVAMIGYPPLPKAHPRVSRVASKPICDDINELILFSTACWRNYQGTWEIKDGHLFLTDLEGCFQITDGAPVRADWFSGVLRVPKGRIFHHELGCHPVNEMEEHIYVEKGTLIKSCIIETPRREYDATPSARSNSIVGRLIAKIRALLG